MVDMYKLKFTVLQQEILRFLFIKAGEKFNARGLAQSLDVSQTAIAKALPALEKDELVFVEKDEESGRWSITLNRDNLKVVGLKRAENLKMIYESGMLNFLFEEFPGCTIVLFGSYSRGEDTTTSDIDIAIIGTKEKNIPLLKFNKMLERTISLNFYENLGKIDKHLRNNILNGIVLSGSIEI